MRQADELIVMVDSSKFRQRSSLILCPLEQVTTIITDDGISADTVRMIEGAGVSLIIANVSAEAEEEDSPSVA